MFSRHRGQRVVLTATSVKSTKIRGYASVSGPEGKARQLFRSIRARLAARARSMSCIDASSGDLAFRRRLEPTFDNSARTCSSFYESFAVAHGYSIDPYWHLMPLMADRLHREAGDAIKWTGSDRCRRPEISTRSWKSLFRPFAIARASMGRPTILQFHWVLISEGHYATGSAKWTFRHTPFVHLQPRVAPRPARCPLGSKEGYDAADVPAAS